ncbi:hypothetical protein Tco_1395587, partial [Tanacetum coccineum]
MFCWTITISAVSSPFEGLSDIGSPGVDGPPMMPEDPYAYVVAAFQAPPSPDYVPGPEEPEQAPPLPKFVPESVYPKFMPPEDDVLPAEEQPLPAAVSPTVNSPGIPRDEADDEDEDDEEEEEHPAPADSVPPPPVHRTTARISIPAQAPVPFLSKKEIPSPPLPVSPPLPISPPPLPASPTYPLGFRAAMIRQRAKSPSTSHSLPLPPPIILSYTRASTPPSGTPPLLPIPLPSPSPPLLLPSTDRRADRPEVCLPPQKRLCIALGPRYEVRESSSAPAARPTGGFRVDYGFVATLDREIRRDPERDDTDEIYRRLDEAQEARAVLSDRLNLLGRDRRSHAYTALLMEREARLSHEVWGRSMDASDTTRSEVRALRSTILAQQTEIVALRATDRPRQAQLVETLILMSTLHGRSYRIDSMFGKMEIVFSISNCSVENQIKFSTCTLLGSGLTWWNSHVTTVGHDVVYAMTWVDLKKKMTDKYCQRTEIKKLEAKLMFPEESDKIERYVNGLPDMIHGSIVASNPKTMQELIEIATELMDKKIRTF